VQSPLSRTGHPIKPTFHPVVTFNSDHVFGKVDRLTGHEFPSGPVTSGDAQSSTDNLPGVKNQFDPTSVDASGTLSDSMSIIHSDHSTDLTLDEAPTDDIFLLSDPRRGSSDRVPADDIPIATAVNRTPLFASGDSNAPLLTSSVEQNVEALSSPNELENSVVEKVQHS